jgi:hypothetical protein
MADDGLDFNGWIKPPEVPPDPVGDDWRGPPGPPGTIDSNSMATWFATLPTTLPASAGLPWNDGGVLAFS